MTKHWITYGSTCADSTTLESIFSKRYDVSFEYRDSSYLGPYCKYEGREIDRLSIELNHFDGDIREESQPDFVYIVYLTINSNSPLFSVENESDLYKLHLIEKNLTLIKVESSAG